MAWVIVPCLLESRQQLTVRFPNREHASDGGIGDTAHAQRPSSHNPDESGKPEHSDNDNKDEVRAVDFDKDLNDPNGITMEHVVQLWINLLRQGQMWWVRYIIFNGRIWHRRDNFVTRVYTGANKHDQHVHVNSEFTQAADNVTNTNWHLQDLGLEDDNHLVVDGRLGSKTIRRWQQIMGTTVDGVITPKNSSLVKAVQTKLKATVDHRLEVDGDGIYQDGRRYKTVGALQRYLKSPVDQMISVPVSQVIKALQRRLNEGRF